ncbi:MAG: NAD(P)-dependent oxidoreductase [Bacteroidetes bacterium]|nr:NAD(P)-dependent oxidoreductase [Bacteroidota bacterium]
MMGNILITGSSGFIGSFLVEEALKRDLNVYAGIRKSSSLAYLQDPRIRFAEIDFTDKEHIREFILEEQRKGIKFDYIIHNAGLTKAQKKEDFYRVNYTFTRNFVEALIESGNVPLKFVYISSLAAYGPGDPVSMKPVMLDDTPNPVDEYGKSKLKAEKYLQSLSDFPWLIIRPSGVYGPREKDYFVYFQTISRGMEPYIGYKPQILTFIYVRDLVRLILDATVSGVTGRSYFVTDGKQYDSREFAAITKKYLQKKTFRITLPLGLVGGIAFVMEKIFSVGGKMPTLNTDKFNIMKSTNWTCQVDGLQKDFNFRAEYDLDKGVKEVLEWYKKEAWL